MEQHQVLLMGKEQIEMALNEMVGKVLKKIKPQPITDWILESKASDILGYANRQHLRKVALANGIKTSKRGNRYYYSLKSINRYLENGTVKEF